MTERPHFHFSISCIGEGNGNPLQCCLENPRDGGACWASVYGVTQSRIRLKWLSSSSSRIGLGQWENEWFSLKRKVSGFLGRELASSEDTGYKVFVKKVKFTGKVIYEKEIPGFTLERWLMIRWTKKGLRSSEDKTIREERWLESWILSNVSSVVDRRDRCGCNQWASSWLENFHFSFMLVEIEDS